MGRVLTAVGLVVFLSGCLVFWAVPWAVERGVTTAFSVLAPEDEVDSVRVRLDKSRPELLFAAGDVGTVRVEIESVDAGQLLFDRMTTVFTSVYVNMASVFDARRFEVFYDRDIAVMIDISEDALTEHLQATGEFERAEVLLNADGAVITATVRFGTEVISVEAGGSFVAKDGHLVSFVLTDLVLDDIVVGDELRQRLLQVLGADDVWLDLQELSIPVRIDDVYMSRGLLHIEAQSVIDD